VSKQEYGQSKGQLSRPRPRTPKSEAKTDELQSKAKAKDMVNWPHFQGRGLEGSISGGA